MSSQASYLSQIFGTEKDKVNCSFYFKIGACRHGDKCERRHNKPTLSNTLIVFGLYPNPLIQNPQLDGNDPKIQEDFEEFYLDIFEEFEKYGEIEEMNVCENICDHMLGNVYVKYRTEEQAEEALKALSGRFFGGKPVVAEFSPVTDFREASCRQFEMNECTRGGICNFIHLKSISTSLYRYLFSRRRRSRSSRNDRDRDRDRDRERSRSRSPHERRRHREDRHRDERGHRDDRHRDREDRHRHYRDERHRSPRPDLPRGDEQMPPYQDYEKERMHSNGPEEHMAGPPPVMDERFAN